MICLKSYVNDKAMDIIIDYNYGYKVKYEIWIYTAI